MAQKTILMGEVKNEQYIVTEFNDDGEEIEVSLPENIRVFTEITQEDLEEGIRNVYALSL